MKVEKTSQNIPFRGLCYKKVNPFDMKKVVEPCLKKLNRLSKKANIELSSSTILCEEKHYKAPIQVLNISVKPLSGVNSKLALSTYSMKVNEENIKRKTLLDITEKAVKMF